MRRWAPAAALGLALALAAPAPAQGYDPRYAWRTIDTPHFRIHFHQGLEPLARRTAVACERAHAALVPLLGHEPPGPVEVVLSDDTDDANGSATVLPRNVVRLYAVPPPSLSELDDYGDWLDSLVLHEYTHVLHLDAVGGLPLLLDRVFGKVLAPAAFGPPWLTEGMAVLHESPPGAGRNASSLFDAWARAQVVQGGGLPGLDVVSNVPLDWPRGSSWYLLGGRFLAFLEARFGDAAVRAFVRDQGRQLWPYFMNTLAERHFGESFDRLWAEFGASLRERYRAQLEAVRARPVTSPLPLTRRGALVSAPRFAPDGRSVVYMDQGLDQRAGLRRAGLDGADLGPLAPVEGNGSFALLPDGRALVAISDVFEEYRSVDDLYLVDLATGARQRLTYGERATDPDVAPGGGWAVYVARLPGGEHALRRIRLDGGRPETLLHRPGAQLYLPRVSPDGRRVALEIQEDGRRDVAVWDGKELRFVTDDDALDQAPAWSPDGRTLYFSSDRSGIFNLYAFELGEERPLLASAAMGPLPTATSTSTVTSTVTSTLTSTVTATSTSTSTSTATSARTRRRLLPGSLRQVTNVEMAALEPDVSPDGTRLAFLTYSASGYDVATLPVAPATWLDPPPPAAARPAHELAPSPPAPDLPSRPYSARETVGPAWWLPYAGSDASGATIGAITAGADVVGRHAWGADASFGLRSDQPSYGLAYAAGWMHPLLSLGTSRSFGGAPDGRPEVTWVPLAATATWTRTHLDRAQSVLLGWRALLLRPQGAPDPADPAPYRGGSASELTAGAAYGSALQFAHSISAEEGGLLSLRLRYAHPSLGGDLRYLTARLSGARYLRIPWTRHVVLALHGSLGLSSGSLPGRDPFSLGGIPRPDLMSLVNSALGGAFPAQADELRGYPSGAFAGPTLVSTTTELRFPMFAPQLGHSTWPLFLRRVHGALFLDAGAAFYTRDGAMGRRLGNLERLRFGAGGELRLEVLLGYQLIADVRLGVARGLGPLLSSSPKPPDPLAETQVYLTVGESF